MLNLSLHLAAALALVGLGAYVGPKVVAFVKKQVASAKADAAAAKADVAKAVSDLVKKL